MCFSETAQIISLAFNIITGSGPRKIFPNIFCKFSIHLFLGTFRAQFDNTTLPRRQKSFRLVWELAIESFSNSSSFCCVLGIISSASIGGVNLDEGLDRTDVLDEAVTFLRSFSNVLCQTRDFSITGDSLPALVVRHRNPLFLCQNPLHINHCAQPVQNLHNSVHGQNN